MEKAFDKSEVEAQLAVGLTRIAFFKTDGTEREMVCTRDMTIIPLDMHPKNEGAQKSTTTIPVYDVEASCWKSFILENLIALDKE